MGKNPDFKLAVINSSNSNFSSKVDSENGSLLMSRFIDGITSNDKIGGFCSHKNQKYLREIMEIIQNELHSERKQLIEFKWNNGTDKIVFVKKSISKNESVLMDIMPGHDVDDKSEEEGV